MRWSIISIFLNLNRHIESYNDAMHDQDFSIYRLSGIVEFIVPQCSQLLSLFRIIDEFWWACDAEIPKGIVPMTCRMYLIIQYQDSNISWALTSRLKSTKQHI